MGVKESLALLAPIALLCAHAADSSVEEEKRERGTPCIEM